MALWGGPPKGGTTERGVSEGGTVKRGAGEVTKCFESEMGLWRINGCDRYSPNFLYGRAGVDAGGDDVGEFAGFDFEDSGGGDWASVDDCDVV